VLELQPADWIQNGDFETGNLVDWSFWGDGHIQHGGCHSGNYCASAGSYFYQPTLELGTDTHGDTGYYIEFKVPPGKSKLSFWYQETCINPATDYVSITLYEEKPTSVTIPVVPKQCRNTGWTQVTVPVTVGYMYHINFNNQDDGDPYPNRASYMLFDDVSLQ
jgi:hypothetical protein